MQMNPLTNEQDYTDVIAALSFPRSHRQLDVSKSFAQNGGTSADAQQFVKEIEKIFFKKVPLSVVQSALPLRYILEICRYEIDPELARLAPSTLSTYLQTINQRSCWTTSTNGVSSPVRNLTICLRVNFEKQALDREVLFETIRRVSGFNTKFYSLNGIDYQELVVPTVSQLHNCIVDLGRFDTETSALSAMAKIRESFEFNLSNPPLVRILVGAVDHHSVICYVINHIAIDGNSINTLVEEILIPAFGRGEHSTISYAERLTALDYSSFQRRFFQSIEYSQNKKWWEQRLAGLSPQDLGWENFKYNAPYGFYDFKIGRRSMARIRDRIKLRSISYFIFFISTFLEALHEITASGDIALISAVDKRLHSRFAKVIGLFTDALIFRSKTDNEEERESLLKKDLAHSKYFYNDIVNYLRRNDPTKKIFMGGLIFINRPNTEKFGIKFYPELVNTNHAMFPVLLKVSLSEGEAYCQLCYAPATFWNKTRAESLAQLICRKLAVTSKTPAGM
jgi:hypothetical protein